jgi:biotin operon repressor
VSILDAIPTGRPNALRKADIARRLGIPTRQVEAEIQKLRLDGEPVVSDEHGYWLGTPDEVRDCANRLRNRAGNQLLTARKMRQTAERMREGLFW